MTCCHKTQINARPAQASTGYELIHSLVPFCVGLGLFVAMRMHWLPPLAAAGFSLPWMVCALATLVGMAYFGWPFFKSAKTDFAKLLLPLILLMLATVLPLTVWPRLIHSGWVALWGGAVAVLSAWVLIQAWRSKQGGISTAISLALCVGWTFSTLLVFYLPLQNITMPHLFFHSVWLLIGVLRLGGLAKTEAANWQQQLISPDAMQQLPDTVRSPNDQKDLQVNDLIKNTVVLIKKGTVSPVDGFVKQAIWIRGGDGVERELQQGELLQAGMTALTADVQVEIDHDGDKTRWAQRRRNLAASQQSKPPLPRLVDSVASWVVPILLTIALGAAAAWGVTAGLGTAMMVFVSVLLSACPCVLFLATPLAGHLALKLADQHGVTFKSVEDLYRLATVRTLICDQNGTLTHGVSVGGEHAQALRLGVKEALAYICGLDIKLALCSGGERLPATKDLSFNQVSTGQKPAAKKGRVTESQKFGLTLMIGDGDNDADALNAADIGICMQHAAQPSREQAQALMHSNDWQSLLSAFKISRRLRQVLHLSIGFACVYNAVMVPLAAGGAYFLTGRMLSPLVAGMAMTGCSLVVVAMALFGMQYGMGLAGPSLQLSQAAEEKPVSNRCCDSGKKSPVPVMLAAPTPAAHSCCHPT